MLFMEAILYQSGPACRIHLLADGTNRPAEDFLETSGELHPDEFAKLIKLLDYSCEHGPPKNKQKVNTLDSMVKIAQALDCEMDFELRPLTRKVTYHNTTPETVS